MTDTIRKQINQIPTAQPPELTACAESFFALVDDFHQNFRDQPSINTRQLRMACEALCSTVEMIEDQRRIDRARKEYLPLAPLDLSGN